MNISASEALSAEVSGVLRVLSDHLSAADVVRSAPGVVEFTTPRFAKLDELSKGLAEVDGRRLGLRILLESTTIKTGKTREDVRLGPSRFATDQQGAVEELRQRVRDRIADAKENTRQFTDETASLRKQECAAHAESARLRQEIVDSQSGLEEDIRRLNDSIGERMELVFLRDAENDRCRELQRKSRDLREYSTQLLEAQARAKVDAARSAEELAREEGCLKRETSELEAARHERDRELLAKLQHLRDVRDGLQRETATLRHEEAPISAETARLQEHAAELLKEAADHAAKTQDLTERAAEVRRGEKERYDAHVAAMPDLENSIAHCLEMQDRHRALQEEAERNTKPVKAELRAAKGKAERQQQVMHELAERAEEAQAEVRQKNDELAAMVTESMAIEQQLQALEADHKAVMASEKRAFANAERERKEKLKVRTQAEEQHAALQATIQAETTAFHDKMQRLSDDTAEARARGTAAEAENSNARADVASCRARIKELRREVPAREESVGVTRAEHNATLATLRSQIGALRVDRERLLLERDTVQRPINKLTAELRGEEARMKEENDTLAELLAAERATQETASVLRQSLETEEGNLRRAQETLAETLQKQQQVDSANAGEREEWATRLATVNARLATVQAMQDRVDAATAGAKAELARVESKLLETTSAVASLRHGVLPALRERRQRAWGPSLRPACEDGNGAKSSAVVGRQKMYDAVASRAVAGLADTASVLQETSHLLDACRRDPSTLLH